MSWDSRNVSSAAWVCSADSGALMALTLDFSASGGAVVSTCGAEVLQPASQTMPAITVSDPASLPASNYTILMVDRDAPSASGPIRSPLRHMALTGVPRAALQAGVSSAAVAAAAYTPYAGPQPPPGSGCHRYYVQVYAEQEGTAPQAIGGNTSRFLWNFTQYASNSSLVLVGGTHFRTQSSGSRVGDCEGNPLPLPAGGPAALGGGALAAAIAAPLLAVAVAGGLLAWWWRGRRAQREEEAGAAAGSSAPYGALPLEKSNPLFE